MISTTYAVNTTPVIIAAARPTESRWIYIDPGAQDIYIGGAGITSVTGMKLTKSVIFAMYLPPLEAVYALSRTGSHDVTVMEPVT